MTGLRVALMDLLRKCSVNDPEFLCEGLRTLAEGLMELEVADKIRAGRDERSDERTTYRNGYGDPALKTRIRRVDLKIPKLRDEHARAQA